MKHATSIIDATAEIAEGVEVGPYAIIGANVRIGEGSRIAAHAIVTGPLVMGARNEVCSFAVLGGAPQVRSPRNAPVTLGAAPPNPREMLSPLRFAARASIGNDNVFREHVTVNLGTREPTRIGSMNLFMAQAHVAHDVTIGSHCVIANAVQLAGHVVVEDYVTFGGLAGIAQFVRIGESAFVAAGSMVEREVPPFCIAAGDRARPRAINRVGLERREIARTTIDEIERVFRAIFHSKTTRAEALAAITTSDPLARRLIDALKVA